METESRKKKLWRTPRGGADKTCSVEGCKRPYRAKSFCFFHFKKWRQGELPHGRYKTCSKAECRKPMFRRGLCEAHFNEALKKTTEAAPAAPPPAAAPPAVPPA
ncbi:MAG TPA: vegetative protein [Myxococcaceae bacterium]|jgi:hypothetical protein|nr:vegetative protein [Myxococcaceae bacterium]